MENSLYEFHGGVIETFQVLDGTDYTRDGSDAELGKENSTMASCGSRSACS